MKQIIDGNRKSLIRRHVRGGVLLPAIVALLLAFLVACRGQVPTAEPATPPVVMTETAATPTLMPATAPPTQATATATPVATQTAPPTETAPSPTSTQDASSGVQDLVTYEDNVAYFALNYPATWHVIDVAQEDKVGMPGYILTFLSWDPAEGMEEIPTGESIVEANVQPKGDMSLEEATSSFKASLGPSESIISENTLTLNSGLPAMRWLLETRAGPTHVLLAVIVDRPVMLRGWGDASLFELVAGSLRVMSAAELPIISNRGAPANERCVVMKAADGLVDVHAMPGAQQPLVARLQNWADVRSTGEGWYEITIPQGGAGWVEASHVSMTSACAIAEPLRIKFPAGASAVTIEGSFSGQARARYLFWAAAGQEVTLLVTSLQNSVLFHLEGVQDGQVYKHLLDGENSWQGTLTMSQDYLLTIDNSDMPAQYTIELSIVDG